jgi:hypothetical protein
VDVPVVDVVVVDHGVCTRDTSQANIPCINGQGNV